MIFPIFQFCLDLINQDEYGLVFPQESEGMMSMISAIPITKQDLELQRPMGNFYYPCFSNGKSFEQELILKKNSNFKYSTFINSIEIEFELVHSFPIKEKNMYFPDSIRYEVLRYIGNYNEFTSKFIGFIPIKVINNDLLREVYNKYDITFIGFTPNFGSRDWVK